MGVFWLLGGRETETWMTETKGRHREPGPTACWACCLGFQPRVAHPYDYVLRFGLGQLEPVSVTHSRRGVLSNVSVVTVMF